MLNTTLVTSRDYSLEGGNPSGCLLRATWHVTIYPPSLDLPRLNRRKLRKADTIGRAKSDTIGLGFLAWPEVLSRLRVSHLVSLCLAHDSRLDLTVTTINHH
jgi:hypothetical protein